MRPYVNKPARRFRHAGSKNCLRELGSVVADGAGRANVQGAPRRRFLVRRGRLFEEKHMRLVIAVFQKIAGLVHAGVARDAGVIHVPFARDVLGLLVSFVGHKFVFVVGALRRRFNLLSGEASETNFADKHFGRNDSSVA